MNIYHLYAKTADRSIYSLGFFKSFALGFARLAQNCNEIDVDCPDNEEAWQEIQQFGLVNADMYTLEKINFEE